MGTNPKRRNRRTRTISEHLDSLPDEMKGNSITDNKEQEHEHYENCRCSIDKRRKTSYSDFIIIQQKITAKYDAKIASMLYWNNGIWCKVCRIDITCVDFNYTKCASHLSFNWIYNMNF